MDEKKIVIEGTHNKYMINKVNRVKKNMSKKKNIDIDDKFFDINYQLDLINETYSHLNDIIKKEIKYKLSSYQQQDKLKKRYDSEKFITYESTKELIKQTSCKCIYCNENLLILYKNKNEKKQWTLDRINNDIGHNNDNVVISCLKCNIQKRDRDHEKFAFTKNLIITKL